MNDTKKIEVIKALLESTKITTIEDGLEMLSDIIHVVYGVDKTEKLFPKKMFWHSI